MSSTLNLKLSIDNNILDQFSKQLKLPIINKEINLNSKLGKGKMTLSSFPNQLEIYHFNFLLNHPVKMNSINPANSDWLLLNINLSKSKITKKVNSKEMEFQKYLPSGILMYTPQTEVESISPPATPFEIALIRFHKSFLKQYNYENINLFQTTTKALIYEDLNTQLERHLSKVISNLDDKIEAHSELLKFISIFIKKINLRDEEKGYQHLHSDDIKGLFIAASQLRNPIAKEILSIESLSKIAGMGSTKFKTYFKQVFGSPPIKYHHKIKMEYAQNQLEHSQKSISEISYELGYSHPSKFTLAYKKQFGKTPSQV